MNIKGIINNRTSAMMQQREHQIHLKRLQAIKPMVDTKKPRKPNHLVFNAKKELYFDYIKKKDINIANKILVKRMVRIDQQEGKLNPRYFQQSKFPSNPSLNFKVREQEQLRILHDNKKIVKHIHRAKSYYPKGEILKRTSFNRYLRDKMSQSSNRFQRNRFFVNMMSSSPSARSMMMNTTLEPQSYRNPQNQKSAILPSIPISPTEKTETRRPLSAPRNKTKRSQTARTSERKISLKQPVRTLQKTNPHKSEPNQSASPQNLDNTEMVLAASQEFKTPTKKPKEEENIDDLEI